MREYGDRRESRLEEEERERVNRMKRIRESEG